jgi:hypothetical protein
MFFAQSVRALRKCNFRTPDHLEVKCSIDFNKMFVSFRSAKLTVWQLKTGGFAKL